MEITWKGVFPAVTTKFTTDDQLDLGAFDKGIEGQLEAGVDGIVLGGSLGEASTLTNDEKITLVKHTVELSAGRVPVVFNIAEQGTKAAIELAKRALDNGADGLMVLPPMRYKADDKETVTYFTEIAKNVPLPIMIYNNPVDYAINVTMDMFGELAAQSNIVAIKESSRDISNITRLYNRFGNRFNVFTGVDTLAMESLSVGAVGWLAGLVNAFPKETVAIYRLMKANRYEEALAIYRWFLPVLELDIHPKLVQYIKLAESRTGLGTEHVRAPRLALTGDERTRILSIIDTAIANRPELPADSWGVTEKA
ncbi:dihydrodipicolinate synthase family protein [Mucilaginibacter glaciei]|uniref:Dihydrodipicolinate synthase family protein n=1 Tax=Mucilaginibacter glaciei TaxID=2772109 RepID=A0A926S1M8_9SPHI|nr:dihydrodipicolinate synthase family protein [Mucilaginibacter glaciei]MBD1394210.1 dihydrodipicolinate synthase family protein [Mucilaginibacter glaciei]